MKFKNSAIFLALACTTLILSCTNGPDYSDTPEIEFVSFSKLVMNQGLINDDFVILTLYFQDGDGNIGFEDTTRDLELIDNRTGDVYDKIKLPVVPDQGTGNGISGEMLITVFNQCCVYPDNIPPCEENPPAEYATNELSFNITLTDRDGNVSNVVTTPSIQLICIK